MRIGRRISMVALNANIDQELIFPTAWATVRKLVATGTLQLLGGTGIVGDCAYISIGSDVGRISFDAPNAAGDNTITVCRVVGDTDTPTLDMLTHRITGVLDPTTAQDALTHHAWANWTPTLAWTTGTPSAITTIARYLQIGKTIFFQISLLSSDSNACTALVISDLPGTIVNVGGETFSAASLQRYGAAGTTYIDPLAYILPSDETIRFRAFQTATDGQAIGVNVSGFYEVT